MVRSVSTSYLYSNICRDHNLVTLLQRAAAHSPQGIRDWQSELLYISLVRRAFSASTWLIASERFRA